MFEFDFLKYIILVELDTGGGGGLGWVVRMISDFVQSFQEMIIHDFPFLFNPMITPPPLFLVQFPII